MALKKSEKKMLIALGIVAVVAGIMLYRIYGPQKVDTPDASVEDVVSTPDVPKTTKPRSSGGGSSGGSGGGGRSGGSEKSTTANLPTVSMQDFSTKNSLDECWVLIKGEVYNITPYLLEYRSDIDEISQFCGTLGFEVGYLNEKPSLTDLIGSKAQKMGLIG